MSEKEMTFKIEEILCKTERIQSLQNTLYVAIYQQEMFSINDFEWAFILLGEITGCVLEELKGLTNWAFENLREGDAH